MLSSKRVVLPLVGSFFLPGKAKETIEEIEDQELAQIAWAEYYFFSAKAKECVENANFKLGKTDNLGDTEKTTRINEAKKELKGIEITEADNINIELNDYNYYYKLTEDNLKDMGLSNIKLSDTDELYIVKYDIQNAKVEIYNTKGYEGKYSLTDIEQIEK